MAPARIHWSEIEWFDVMRLVIAERERTGAGWVSIIMKAQKKVLPKSRQRSPLSFKGHTLDVAQEYGDRIRIGWIPEGRAEEPTKPVEKSVDKPIDKPAVSPTPRLKRDGTQGDRDRALESTFTSKANVFWTRREWAIVACAVKHRIEQGDTRGLPRLFFEMQTQVLPLDRCRKMGGFAALPPLQAAYDDAVPRIWTLPPDIIAKCEGRGKEYEAAKAKAAAGVAHQVPIEPPAPEPEPMPAPAPEVIPLTVSAPAPDLAVLSQFPIASSDDPLAARIALILGQAAAQISATTRAHVMAEYDRQLDRLVGALAASLREHVHGLVSAELGPLSTAPTPPAAPVAPAAPSAPESSAQSEPQGTPDKVTEAAPPLPRLKVDIVGMERLGTMQVRAVADKLGIDVRLIDSDHTKGTWEPRATVILATQFVPHAATRTAKKAGASLLFANAGPASVVGLLESLAEHRGDLQ
jgi:hypothetical protein